MDHRNVYAIPELDPTDNDIDNSITIDLGDLPRYDVAVGPSNDDDVVIEEAEKEEDEEDWETESDDSDDNEINFFLANYSLRDERTLYSSRKGYIERLARRIQVFFVAQSEEQFQPHSAPTLNPTATSVEPRSFPAVAVHPAAVISSLPLFSLLRAPNPEIEMSDLVRRRRAVTTTLSSEPPAQPVSAATAPALREQNHVLAGPGGSQAPASSASSVVQPISARQRHRPSCTTDTTSTDDTGSSGAPPAKRNTRGLCRQLKTAKTNYHLEDLNEESMAYVNRLFGERYKQWKSDLHHHFEAFDDPQVALQEGCPKELEGREDSWAWLCAHFQAPDYVNKAQVNKGNRKKKTLLHHSGSRPFSYRMDARRRGGSKFPEIDVFGDVYVRPGNELAESLHVNDDGGEEPVGSARVRLPTSSRDSDRVCGSSAGCWISDFDADANSQVTVLTLRVAKLEGQMSVILQSLARFGIPIPNFGASISEPVHPEHPQQTTAPADAQTSEPHVADDQVDFGTLFDSCYTSQCFARRRL
ncbi:unnamed protein product [Prunus brigantina]